MQAVWNREQVIARVREAIIQAGIILPEDIRQAISFAMQRMQAQHSHALTRGVAVLEAIQQNLTVAESTALPLCQDTGMAVLFADAGEGSGISEGTLEEALIEAVRQAYDQGLFRKSVVVDPVFERTNTQTNLPPVIHWRLVAGTALTVSGMLKGFGSENCSSLHMLNPTAGRDGVIQAVIESVRKAGGKPCPPVIVGVGIGGTSEQAMVLAKRALLRKLDQPHPDSRYAALERELLVRINELGIGPGGLGGNVTALGVLIEDAPTHLAGLPVAVNISCWADRTFIVEIGADG